MLLFGLSRARALAHQCLSGLCFRCAVRLRGYHRQRMATKRAFLAPLHARAPRPWVASLKRRGSPDRWVSSFIGGPGFLRPCRIPGPQNQGQCLAMGMSFG